MRKIFKSKKSEKSSKSSSKKSPKSSFKQKFNQKTAHWNFVKLTRYFMVIGALIAIITSYFWYSQIYMSPERRFWTAINNSMVTPSVVRTLTEGGSGNEVIQDFRFHFAPQRVVENKVQFSQKSATVDTYVVTEGIVFPNEQFLRYSAFRSETDEQSAFDLESVIGLWASETNTDPEESSLSYLGEQVTLAIFGNFDANVRNGFMKQLKEKNVYGSELGLALEDEIDGQTVLNYSVAVSLKDYVSILNESFIAAGYGEFPALNPENYRDGSTVKSNFYVNKRNNTIVGISFGDRQEKYSNYGVLKTVESPQADLTIEELQTKIQTLVQ
jgi:hypothetical protein